VLSNRGYAHGLTMDRVYGVTNYGWATCKNRFRVGFALGFLLRLCIFVPSDLNLFLLRATEKDSTDRTSSALMFILFRFVSRWTTYPYFLVLEPNSSSTYDYHHLDPKTATYGTYKHTPRSSARHTDGVQGIEQEHCDGYGRGFVW
jgi:hypothetical protein